MDDPVPVPLLYLLPREGPVNRFQIAPRRARFICRPAGKYGGEMKRIMKGVLVVVVAALSIGITGVAWSAEPIKVGVLLPLTGSMAKFGEITAAVP